MCTTNHQPPVWYLCTREPITDSEEIWGHQALRVLFTTFFEQIFEHHVTSLRRYVVTSFVVRRRSPSVDSSSTANQNNSHRFNRPCPWNGSTFKCFETHGKSHCKRNIIHCRQLYFNIVVLRRTLQLLLNHNNNQQRSLLSLFGRFAGGCWCICVFAMLRKSNSQALHRQFLEK